MNEKDPGQKITVSPQEPIAVAAKSASISSPPEDYPQFVNTVKSFTVANMPFEPIINVAHSKGYPVEVTWTDSSVKTNMPANTGQVIEEENRILAIQNRGESITVSLRVTAPASATTSELITYSNNPSTSYYPEQADTASPNATVTNVPLLEGIEVKKPEKLAPQITSGDTNSPISFVGPLTDAQLEEAKGGV